MLLSLMKYVQGYVYVRLTGYAPERFLNLCGNHNILIWNLMPCEDGYEFCISVQGFRSLKPILKKTRTHICILRRVGLPFTAFRYRKRRIFCGGIIFFGIFLYYLSGFVWNIEITGNSYLSNEVILDFLEEEACTFGTKKKDVDCAALEEALRSKYSEVIWTSIKLYGTKMTVELQESLLPETEYIAGEEEICDIVAAKDGIITEIITRSGTPLVAAGAEVKAGDVLVSGRLAILDDSGETAEYLYKTSDADIFAHVIYPYEDIIAKNYTDTVQTGHTQTNYTLMLGAFTVQNPFFKNSYTDYEVTTDTTQICIADNFFLPVFITREDYYEVVYTEKSYSEQEIRQIAARNLTNYLKDLEEKGIQIITKDVIIKRMGNQYVASGTITACESIVSYQPTEVYHIRSEERQSTDESD